MKDVDKQAYDEANAEIKKYFNSQKFNLFLMKDAREDELAHMVDTFKSKEELLAHYKDALTIQEGHLKKAHQIEIDLLTWIQEEFPTIAELYEEIYGISIPESIQKSIDAMEEWLVLQGQKPKEKTTAITPITRTPIETRTIAETRRRKMFEEDWGFSRGIDYMPRTQRVLVHEGESIVPAGKTTGDSIVIENVTIQVKQIADIGSVEKVGAIIGAVGQSGLIGRRGKVKFGMV